DALSVSLKKGFLLGGCSAWRLSLRALSFARGNPLFSDTPITGQYLAVLLLMHIDAYSHRFTDELVSIEKKNKDIPMLTKELTVWTLTSLTDPEMSLVLERSRVNLSPAFFRTCRLGPLRDDALPYDCPFTRSRVQDLCKNACAIQQSTLHRSFCGAGELVVTPVSRMPRPSVLPDTEVFRTIPARRQNCNALATP
ncbi:hypothetical protein BJY52DRAFT_1119587, partial [Lactarius psammicola]